MMQDQTLETALRAEYHRRRSTALNVEEAASFLIVALRSSATHMDQIVQRRIGIGQEANSDSN